jgi:hypothetical protein
VLASSVGSDEVVTVWDLHVTMRRHTDFVLCQRCLALYPVDVLRQPART